jgi:hypothetical protein
MKDLRWLLAGTALGLAALGPGVSAAQSYDHVLLISIDGMHAVDLSTYITNHPTSTLATLSASGLTYSNAMTTAPSDSFPGLLAQVTGGTSKSTGVFYDDSYDRLLFPPGSNCVGLPGTETVFAENIDKSLADFTGGGTLGQPLTQIDPAQLPLALNNGQCTPVYPHQFIKVNTIFEVIRSHGGQTAWADKHPAYDIVNGPSGAGVQDLFTPEVNSNDAITGQDTTTGFCSIQRNDALKVQAVLNEIDGLPSIGGSPVGVPTIFGMNFQAVSVGQKLAQANASDSFVAAPPILTIAPPLLCNNPALVGGYSDAVGMSPRNGLQYELAFVDQAIGLMTAELKKAGISDNTLVIISAKHGQSPIDLSLRVAVDPTPYNATPGFASTITDDVSLLWLHPQVQQTDYKAAQAYLTSQKSALGIDTLLDKSDLAPLYGNPFGNNRTPDFIARTIHGLIYTGGTKLAEHGGFAADDGHVALLAANPAITAATLSDEVETRQIATTILSVLGIKPQELEAARKENTTVLPGF